NRFSTRREFRSMFFADLRADARGLVSVWGAGAQSQPIVHLSAHVAYSYSYFTLEDHVFEIACTRTISSMPPKILRSHPSSGWPEPAGLWSDVFRKPKGKWVWITMRFVHGRDGTDTLPWPWLPMPF